eukprot:CAMPEP_0113571772 /NCGR_PEP_ID=MMETSP0015_2-20120614/25738_1 /TAXON_ID=2838 /ORGANISM="Odontella" /LENGTH=437 /DNA_ID=CAMNT_0000474757 /DNA_START=99 /DNA_END=1409 /DNA_ORIENTATION=+ /assembly_acc=CAM_ASM_000160
MGNVVAGIVAGLGWCFCTAAASLCSSCCGNDKSSSVPPSATSGRRRSVFLLVISIALALAFQYGVAPALQPDGKASEVPRVGGYLIEVWSSGCQYETSELRERCSGNTGVYRVASATVLFFLLAAIAAACKPTANREAWPAKYVLFIFLVAGTVFISNDPLFFPVYMNIGRIGAVMFIFFQQIILIDLAFNLNESWVEKADRVETDEGGGAGRRWFGAILATCGLLYAISFTVIVLMFLFFSGCRSNVAFISVTLAMGIIVTVVQLSGEEASLLTSAVIVTYATYLCLTAVSKNPNGACNPKLGDEDILGIILGIGFTLLSLAWTGWSFTAESKINGGSSDSTEDSSVGNEHLSDGPNDQGVKGVVANQNYGTNTDEETGGRGDAQNGSSKPPRTSWRLNVVLALVACWFSMALTGWGAIETGGNAANPDVSNVSMW